MLQVSVSWEITHRNDVYLGYNLYIYCIFHSSDGVEMNIMNIML